MADVCRDSGMLAAGAMRNWATENREGFAALCQSAREIADNGRNDWTPRHEQDGKTNPHTARYSASALPVRAGAQSARRPRPLPIPSIRSRHPPFQALVADEVFRP
jgi:hypothetical protein